MAKLTFGTIKTPPPLRFWTARKGEAFTRWLPDNEFEAAARKYGVDPKGKGAFAVWDRAWWKPASGKIFLRASHLNLFAHEARHIETRSNFHDGERRNSLEDIARRVT